jgi:hypothetical protein
MKTALSIVGIVFLVLLFLGACFIGFVVYEGNRYDATSKAYADESVQAIAANWSKDELAKREAPEFQRVTSDEQLTELFSKLSTLGPLQNYSGSKGDANVNLTPSSGLRITAVYVGDANCQNGKAEIKLTLIAVDGGWKILGFRVNSPVFGK